MAALLRSEQFYTAQRAYENLIPDETAYYRAEAIDGRALEMLSDHQVRREIATDVLPFELDGEWFTDTTVALIQLDAKHPSDLLGSQLLVDLYRLAHLARLAAFAAAHERASSELEAAG